MALSPGSGLISSFNSSGSIDTSKSLLTPWLDYTSVALPDNHSLAIWWAQYLWLSDPNYNTAMKRVAAHFLTTIEFPDLKPTEGSQWQDFFTNQFNYRQALLRGAFDFLAYGNLFASLYIPFTRFMICPGCHAEQPISKVDYNLEFLSAPPWIIWRKVRPCSVCGNNEAYDVKDRLDSDLGRIKLNFYSPFEIELAFNRHSERKAICWKIQDEDRRNYLGKARIFIDDTPLEVLQTVAANGVLKFNDDLIVHESEPTISGVYSNGWGIPASITCFRSSWLQQLNNKVDQAVAIDYTLGIRTISPKSTATGLDPMQAVGMDKFVAFVQNMIATHRNNPTSYHTLPYALEYQFLGGEGANLLVPEKLKFRQQEYLNQLGVPLEWHQMNVSTQAAPMSMRLFESYWQSIPNFYNRLLTWITKTLIKVYNMDETKVQMQKTTIVDDMERKAALIQLMSANQISPQTALQPFGVDAHEEVKKVMSHQEFVADVQADFDEKAAKKQEMGLLKGMTAQPTPSSLAQQQMGAQGAPPAGMPMGGMPMGGTPGSQGPQPQSLSAISEQAQQIAQQLVTMPEYDRKQQLTSLREGNRDLHALVRQYMDQIRSQAQSQGGNMLLQQGAMQPPQQ